MIDGYDWAGGREAMLRFGPDGGPVVVAAMPLLEEWNRTRALVVAILRALGRRGVSGALPDLPGHGESLAPLPDLDQLRAAMAAALAHVGSVAAVIGIRGGALLDTGAAHRRWYLSPASGADLLRDLGRVEAAGGRTPVAFLPSLDRAEPAGGARVVRFDTDRRPADRRVPGTAPWRRAEPASDPALADVLADDIVAWLRPCGG